MDFKRSYKLKIVHTRKLPEMQINECDDARTWARFDHMKANAEQSTAQNAKKRNQRSLSWFRSNEITRQEELIVWAENWLQEKEEEEKTPTDREERKKNVKSN